MVSGLSHVENEQPPFDEHSLTVKTYTDGTVA